MTMMMDVVGLLGLRMERRGTTVGGVTQLPPLRDLCKHSRAALPCRHLIIHRLTQASHMKLHSVSMHCIHKLGIALR